MNLCIGTHMVRLGRAIMIDMEKKYWKGFYDQSKVQPDPYPMDINSYIQELWGFHSGFNEDQYSEKTKNTVIQAVRFFMCKYRAYILEPRNPKEDVKKMLIEKFSEYQWGTQLNIDEEIELCKASYDDSCKEFNDFESLLKLRKCAAQQTQEIDKEQLL